MSNYFVMEPVVAGGMLLNPVAYAPGEQSWTIGQRIQGAVNEPIPVMIKRGFEAGEPLPYLGVPPVMRRDLLDVILGAGVANVDVYQAQVKSYDGSLSLDGYVVFNIVGVVRGADLRQTVFAEDNPSRAIDASIDQLALDEQAVGGQLMFRLAEYTGAVVVHASVRRAVEAAGFPRVSFTDIGAYRS